MARPLRVDYPGALHHVIFKGNEERVIFWEEFLKMLKELTRRYRFINHVHLLIETAHEPHRDYSLGMFIISILFVQGWFPCLR